MADILKNFTYSTVATAPSPALSGTSLVVAAGDGAKFAFPAYAIVWPPNVNPSTTNAEIVRVTNVVTDTLTITRTQEGSTNQSIAVGWQIQQGMTAGLLAQFAALSGAAFTGAVAGTTFSGSGEITGTDFKATGLTGATTARRFVGGTTAGAPASGTFAVGDFIIDNSATIWVCTVAGTPGTWSPTESLTLVRRSATATAFPGEVTVFNGSTTSQTITLPATPVEGSRYFMVNNASVTVNILGGTNSLSIAGTTYSAATPFTVLVNAWYSFVFDATGIWYAVDTNNLNQAVGTLAVANGGTGATTAPAALTALGAAPIASPTFTGTTTAPEFSASGLAGATAASRYVGATASGAPVSGTFAVGDFVIDQTGKVFVCTTAGTPGTWTQVGGGAPATTVVGPDTYSSPAVVGTSLLYARADHDHGLPAPPGAALSYQQNFISVNVTLAVANTVYNITSLTLPAGTWLIHGQTLGYIGNASQTQISTGIGPNSASFTNAYSSGVEVGTGSTNSVNTCTISAVVVLAVSTTVYLFAEASSTGNSIFSATAPAVNTTGLIAVKIA